MRKWEFLISAVLSIAISLLLFSSLFDGVQRSKVAMAGNGYILHAGFLPMPDVLPHAGEKVHEAAPMPVSIQHQSHGGYLPANRLTQKPFVLRDIEPELIAAYQGQPAQRLVFQLLINEYGDVDQVVVEESSLPADLLAELKQRFLYARFAPGQLHDKAVASALRIVVMLEPD